MNYEPVATDCISNSSIYCLINSVAFHPMENLFCATFSGRCMLIFYVIDGVGRARVFQKISDSKARLKNPQHAVFSRDGERVIVTNWSGETFTIYARLPSGSYSPVPVGVIPFSERIAGHKPHGLDISPSGKFIAVAFGAAANKPKAIAIFAFEQAAHTVALLSLLDGIGVPGIPKGICFSPDETHVMVTFSDVNCINLYRFDPAAGTISETPCQTLQGSLTGLNRPEDVKLSHGRDQVLVSNSGSNSIAFYRFDAFENRIVQPNPEYVMGQREFGLEFPHGLAVSPDGRYLVASQFGPLPTTSDEDIVFGRETPVRQAKLWIFERSGGGRRKRVRRSWPWTPWFRVMRDRVERRS